MKLSYYFPREVYRRIYLCTLNLQYMQHSVYITQHNASGVLVKSLEENTPLVQVAAVGVGS